MTVKSIIDIDVNDASFKRFQESFSKYQAMLAKTPGAWAQVGKEQGEISTSFERMAAALMAQNEMAREAEEVDEHRLKRLTTTERLWTSMSKSSGVFAKNVLDASVSLVKWSSLIASGVIAGSMFGIDKMAGSVASDRQSSKGFGMSIGEMKAFRTSFSRMVDPDSFLSWINEMEMHPDKSAPFSSLTGGSPTGNTEADATRVLQSIWSMAQSTPLATLGTTMNAYGVPLSDEQLHTMQSTGGSEMSKMLAQNRENVDRSNVPDPQAQNWQNLKTQFEANLNAISGSVETRLGNLAPSIGHVSDAFTRLATTAINSPAVEQGIEGVGHWLDDLAKEIEKPDFQKSVKDFFADTGTLATSIHNFYTSVKEDLPGIAKTLHWIAHPFDSAQESTNPYVRVPITQAISLVGGLAAPIGDIAGAVGSQMNRSSFAANPNKADALSFLSELDRQFKLPANTSAMIWQLESSSQFNPANSSKGAQGPFQIMPREARAAGIDPNDFRQAAYHEAQFTAGHLGKYHNDMSQALAAYNWGEGNLDADLKKHPNDWQTYLPKETRDYIARAQRGNPQAFSAQAPGVAITISNNTGGNAVVSASQLPQ